MLDARALRRLVDAVEAAQSAADATAIEWSAVVAMGLDMAVQAASRRRLRGLTQVESDLICTLALARGYVLSHGDLLERLGITAEKSIPVMLSNVKRARPDLRAHVETIYGVGYRWTGPPLGELV